MLCDKHVIKMILETAQLLSTAQHVIGYGQSVDPTKLYRKTHVNHPSAIWVRSSLGNYQWAFEHYKALMAEYSWRYGKVHASQRLCDALGDIPATLAGDFTEPPKCMPDEYKKVLDTVEAYRLYYVKDKARFCKWTNRQTPQWFVEAVK